MTKEKQVVELYKQGKTIEEIMQAVEIKQAGLYDILDLHKLRRKNHHLNDSYFLEVVSNMKKSGLSQKEIAKRLNVCCATISNALRKRGYCK